MSEPFCPFTKEPCDSDCMLFTEDWNNCAFLVLVHLLEDAGEGAGS